jgi:hypothetical protein
MSRDRKPVPKVEAYPDPVKPPGMGELASRWWDQVIACKRGQIGPLESFLVERGCYWLGLIELLQSESARLMSGAVPGPPVRRARPGRPRRDEEAPAAASALSPLVTIPRIKEIAQSIGVVEFQFLRICSELGLTPKSAKQIKPTKVIPAGSADPQSRRRPSTALDALRPRDLPRLAAYVPAEVVEPPADAEPVAGDEEG